VRNGFEQAICNKLLKLLSSEALCTALSVLPVSAEIAGVDGHVGRLGEVRRRVNGKYMPWNSLRSWTVCYSVTEDPLVGQEVRMRDVDRYR
jgi:hypothetical protein